MRIEDLIEYLAHMIYEAMCEKSLHEAKSLLLKELEEKFGEQTYSSGRSYKLTKEDCQFIFDTINDLNKDGLDIRPYVPKNMTYDELNSEAVKAALLSEDLYESKIVSAKAFADLLMKLNPSIVNAIPNDDGSVTVIST